VPGQKDGGFLPQPGACLAVLAARLTAARPQPSHTRPVPLRRAAANVAAEGRRADAAVAPANSSQDPAAARTSGAAPRAGLDGSAAQRRKLPAAAAGGALPAPGPGGDAPRLIQEDDEGGGVAGAARWLAAKASDPAALRTLLVAPLTEEWVFRACLVPLLALEVCVG
jgi:hypothetical protein